MSLEWLDVNDAKESILAELALERAVDSRDGWLPNTWARPFDRDVLEGLLVQRLELVDFGAELCA